MFLLSHSKVVIERLPMKNFTRNRIPLAVACVMAFGVFSTSAIAQLAPAGEHMLVTDSSGAPVFTGFGECLSAGFGPARQWTRGCDPTPVAQYTAPVAPEPNAAPMVMAAAAPLVVYEKVAFDANVMFDSDKSALRPAGRDTLDDFIKKIGGLEAESVLLVGYADRMGSEASNQTLSQARVDTVKAYLVSKGITAKRVQTSAWGESRPTTFSGECKDANNAKNVQCMQADRHVFIEVSGTRIAQ
jgi:OOP family OmpA-OmpF porin